MSRGPQVSSFALRPNEHHAPSRSPSLKLEIVDDPAQECQSSPPKRTDTHKKIRFLDGLRGLAAIMVVAAHSMGMTANPGPPAVDTFFVLSAFLLTMGFEKKARDLISQQASYRRWGWVLLDYAQRRVLRVYPLFILVAIYLGLQTKEDQKRLYNVQNEYDLWKVLTFAKEARYFVFWTLPLEIQYYFFIPVFAVAIVKLGKYWWAPVPPAMVYVLHAGFTWFRWWDQPLGPHFPTFLTGSIAAVVYKRVDAWITRSGFGFRWHHTMALRLVEFVVLALLLSTVFNGLLFHWIIPNPVPQTPGVPFIHVNLAVVLVCEMLQPSAIARMLEWSLFRHAGKVSFSVYLLHGFVVHSLWVWQQKTGYDVVFSMWGTVFVVATVSYHLVEAPCFRIASWLGAVIRKREAEAREREVLAGKVLPSSLPLPEAGGHAL